MVCRSRFNFYQCHRLEADAGDDKHRPSLRFVQVEKDLKGRNLQSSDLNAASRAADCVAKDFLQEK